MRQSGNPWLVKSISTSCSVQVVVFKLFVTEGALTWLDIDIDIDMTWHDLTLTWLDIEMTWHWHDLTFTWLDIDMTWYWRDLTLTWLDIDMTWYWRDAWHWHGILITWHWHDWLTLTRPNILLEFWSLPALCSLCHSWPHVLNDLNYLLSFITLLSSMTSITSCH